MGDFDAMNWTPKDMNDAKSRMFPAGGKVSQAAPEVIVESGWVKASAEAANQIKVILPGCLRIKKNSKRIFGMGGFKKVLPSKGYEAWEEQARAALWGHAIVPPITWPVSVEAHIYFRGQRPDLSGCMESIGDCLEGIIWADDRQIESWDGSRMHHDLKNPRTEITVTWEADL
jgi:Holliday junction resolvase RusA-like endonuclease